MAEVLVDSYSESNVNIYGVLRTSGASIAYGYSQSFTAIGVPLSSCKFFLKKAGSPTGNMTARLYSHSGAYGTSSVPGTLLATSDDFDVSTLTTTAGLKTFTFSGAEKYSMVNGTKYCIVLYYGSGDSTNNVQIGVDSSSPSHDGNAASTTDGSSWSSISSWDLAFYVYGEVTTTTQTTTAKSRIKKTETKTTTIKGRIRHLGEPKSLQAKATIGVKPVKRLTVKSKIIGEGRSDLTAKAKIGLHGEKFIQSKSRINKETLKSTDVKARLQGTNTKTITAKSSVKTDGITQDIQSKSRINVSGNDKLISIKGRIATEATKILTAKSRVASPNRRTIRAKSRIKHLQTGIDTYARASIYKLLGNTLTAKALIANTQLRQIKAKARIWDEPVGLKKMYSSNYPVTMKDGRRI